MAKEPTARLKRPELLASLMAAANNGDGFSYRDMADRCSCGKTMIGNLVTGEDETCSQSLAERIVEVLRVPFDYLFAADVSANDGRSTASAAKAVA